MPRVEIAPNIFVESWDDVFYGYRHCCGSFIIEMKDGKQIQQQKQELLEMCRKQFPGFEWDYFNKENENG